MSFPNHVYIVAESRVSTILGTTFWASAEDLCAGIDSMSMRLLFDISQL